MEALINYILESGVSLAVLTIVYVLLLRKETFFKQNRVFLLGSILFSILLPFVKLPSVTVLEPVMLPEITVSPYKSIIRILEEYSQSGILESGYAGMAFDVIVYFYLTGVLFFFFRMLFRIVQLAILIHKNEVDICDGYKVVYLNRRFSPFSFLNYVFVSEEAKHDVDTQKILLHELEHIKQGHTIDILLLEILTVFQWFNPFIYMLKRVVRENHEFLADRGVLLKGVSRGEYKQLLLNQYVGQQYMISNSFNYSLIKKRMKMMSKNRSSKPVELKYLFGFVIAAMLLTAFGCEQHNALPEQKEPVFFIVEQMPDYPGGEQALRDFIASAVNYPEEAKEKGIEGRVYVSFTIADDGKVTDVKIARGVDPILDKEALRVVSSMPDWKPGMQRGVPVNVQFTVPIIFTLE